MTKPTFNKVSNKRDEKFTSAIGLGDLLEKPEGTDLQTDKPIESYTVVCKNRTWGRKTQFTYETVQDAQSVQNLLSDTVGSWGKSLPRTKDRWYANFFNYGAVTAGNAIYNNGITGVVDDPSGNLIYDGQPWFVANDGHKDKAGNGYSNYAASRSLTHSNLQTTYITYTTTNAKDEKGNNIELIPDTLLIPPALRFTAQVILNTTLLPGSMDLNKGSLILKRILKNGVNCWNTLANKAKAISSQAWKVIVMTTRVPCISMR